MHRQVADLHEEIRVEGPPSPLGRALLQAVERRRDGEAKVGRYHFPRKISVFFVFILVVIRGLFALIILVILDENLECQPFWIDVVWEASARA